MYIHKFALTLGALVLEVEIAVNEDRERGGDDANQNLNQVAG